MQNNSKIICLYEMYVKNDVNRGSKNNIQKITIEKHII